MSHKVLFQVTGSIAAFKAAHVISQLVKNGHEVQTVATPSALEFIGPATFEGLTGKSILTNSFENGQMMGHIEWARWADIVILCPATAKSINSLAAGTAEGLVGDIFLANNFLRPYLIVPAMNAQMYHHPATQRSLQQLQSWGCHIMETGAGILACGEVGDGRMAEPQEVLKKIDEILIASTDKPKILITAGGTCEPIDGVRNITNFSTGETGRFLAEYLKKSFDVFYVKSETAALPVGVKNVYTFKSSDQLEQTIKCLVSEFYFDSVIQAAAVSDFKLKSINGLKPDENSKLNSDEKVTLELSHRPKIIDQIKNASLNQNIKVIGFKLTQSENKDHKQEQIFKLSMNPNIDFVVHNEINTTRGLQHRSEIYKRDQVILKTESKVQLAQNIERLIQGNL